LCVCDCALRYCAVWINDHKDGERHELTCPLQRRGQIKGQLKFAVKVEHDRAFQTKGCQELPRRGSFNSQVHNLNSFVVVWGYYLLKELLHSSCNVTMYPPVFNTAQKTWNWNSTQISLSWASTISSKYMIYCNLPPSWYPVLQHVDIAAHCWRGNSCNNFHHM
jgi:hypothetical protein